MGQKYLIDTNILIYFIAGLIPEYQRKGIGTKLMDEIRSFAKEKGINMIDLPVWGKTSKHIIFILNIDL